ncbi:MAG: hypothetical protein AMXMBFR47_36420 [Planctomycetota bacterium]
MVNSAVAADFGFRVLCGEPGRSRPSWSGALPQIFDLGQRVLASVQADIRLGRLHSPAFLAGDARLSRVTSDLETLLEQVDAEYDIELHSPFEETASIAGALWSGRDLFGPGRDDGLAKLSFSAGTLDLPLHVHEHSDRFIAVLAGAGRFWWSQEPWRAFSSADIRSMPVRVGDVLVFTRDLLHTFSAPAEDLVLLSYHSPEIAFDDPRQYTLPALRWTPRQAGTSDFTE